MAKHDDAKINEHNAMQQLLAILKTKFGNCFQHWQE
jgi:hypothetical protein